MTLQQLLLLADKYQGDLPRLIQLIEDLKGHQDITTDIELIADDILAGVGFGQFAPVVNLGVEGIKALISKLGHNAPIIQVTLADIEAAKALIPPKLSEEPPVNPV